MTAEGPRRGPRRVLYACTPRPASAGAHAAQGPRRSRRPHHGRAPGAAAAARAHRPEDGRPGRDVGGGAERRLGSNSPGSAPDPSPTSTLLRNLARSGRSLPEPLRKLRQYPSPQAPAQTIVEAISIAALGQFDSLQGRVDYIWPIPGVTSRSFSRDP